MVEIEKCDFDARMYTTHGMRKNLGKWARVNNKVALVYTQGKDDEEKIVGYELYEDMIPILTSGLLPEYFLDF